MPSTYFCEVCLSSTIRIQTTRGFLILVARLTAREHKRFFSLCHYFAIMKPVAENESRHLGQKRNGRIERQGRTSRQHERLQARAKSRQRRSFESHWCESIGKDEASS